MTNQAFQFFRVSFLVVLFISPALWGASENQTVATIQNDRVRVAYHIEEGTFDVVELPSGRPVISSAHSEIEQWKSSDSNFVRVAKTSHVTDDLGPADRLVVKCSRPDGLALIAEFEVHGNTNSFVTLRLGLENRTVEPLRIKNYFPLSGGLIFPGGKWENVHSLNGDSSCAEMSVTPERFRRSANNLLLTMQQNGRRRSLVLGALATADFTKWAQTTSQNRSATQGQPSGKADVPVVAALEASDPVGRLVDAGSTYLPQDSFYLDGGTANPFEALENYGRELRAATHAKPHAYDFPTVCAWYAGVWKTKGAQHHPDKSTYKINTSAGLVEEAEKMQASGFLNYSRAAGRLVPDCYTTNNPQGWWDDEHWQMHGYYTAPFETSAKFGAGMHQQGVLAFIYIQPSCYAPILPLSKDFRDQHTSWLCEGNTNRTIDLSQPVVQDYLRQKFGALRGHIDGLMADYCDRFWKAEASKGGFADPHMTATAFYRMFFRCVKDGLGPDSWLHERNLKNPNNDLTLGIIDSQRVSGDTDKINPDIISRSGLRWYKNRVVINYDMDSKEINSAWKIKGWTGSDADGRRMVLTMAYVAASRLLLANSFREFTPEQLYDLEHTFPYTTEPRSARPVDTFSHDGLPRVYDFAVSPEWHQVTLFNNTLPTREETISVPLSGDISAGALGLDPSAEYYVYDFWNNHFVGRFKGGSVLEQKLRPGEARMLAVHKVEPNPQFISTSRHIMQGDLDMIGRPVWDSKQHVLSGISKVIGGETYEIVIALNGFQATSTSAGDGALHLEPFLNDANLVVLKIDSPKNAAIEWKLTCK
jgi:hypothetical protein